MADGRLAIASEAAISHAMQAETLSIRISKRERAALRAVARREKVSQGQVVRQALRAYGVAPKVRPAMNAYDLIKDLIGKNKGGPGDLATNPKYLEGLGR